MQTGNGNLRIQRNLLSVFLLSLISFFVSIGCCYFALFSVSFRFGLISSANRFAEDTRRCMQQRPTAFFVGSEYAVPAAPRENATEWCAALRYALEATYRAQGRREGLIATEEYVRFSQTALAECVARHYGRSAAELSALVGREIGGAVFGDPRNIAAYGALAQSVFVRGDEGAAVSPLRIEEMHVREYRGAEAIKRALVANRRPLAVAMAVPHRRIGNATFGPVPPWLLHPAGSGAYARGPRIVASIVGFDDALAVRGVRARGGFVLRNEHARFGHSLRYLQGRVGASAERAACLDPGDVALWGRADAECLAARGNATECNATELECVDARYCNVSMSYAYRGGSEFVVWSEEVRASVTTIDIEDRYYLPLVVTPRNWEINEELCRYQIMPYETVEEMIRNNCVFDFEAVDIEVTWSRCSYYRERCRNYNYGALIRETRIMNESFDHSIFG